jgi:hypothetical protein
MATMLEVGSYKTPSHYAIIGSPVDFYIWVREEGDKCGSHSKWFIGMEAFDLYSKFRRLDKKSFIELARATHKKHRKE